MDATEGLDQDAELDLNLGAIELSILLPAFAAGLLVTATHVPGWTPQKAAAASA